MAALRNRAGHYIFTLWFLSSFFFFPRLISAVTDWMSTILPHTVWSENLECRSEMCCTRLAGNTGCKNDAKNRHLRTIAQLCRAVSSQHLCIDNRKKASKQQYVLHMSSQYGELPAEIGSGVWGTSTNFNGFRVLASLLHRRRSPKANQTLHDVWPSPGLLHYMYIFGSSCPLTEFYQVQNALCVQVLRSPILAALLHSTRIVGLSQALRRSAQGATYIRKGGHHVGHRATF